MEWLSKFIKPGSSGATERSDVIKVKRIVALKPGIYEATLKSVKERQVKAYQSEEMEDVITFTYEIESDPDPIELYRDCRPTLGPKARLYKDLKGMAPDSATDEVFGDDATFNQLLKSLVHKHFLIQTDVTESGNTKIVAVMAKPRGKVAAPVQPVSKVVVDSFGDDEPPPMDDDDIPF